jgi:phosphatidylserine/phosphatidylglycerophosphate/cardiolipin synthase-like enzyme
MNELREHAERLVRKSVRRSDLALVFDETVASTAEVHVDGRNFYPPMLRDIENAASSVHINQFGFRPGVVGDRFAEPLIVKSREGVP